MAFCPCWRGRKGSVSDCRITYHTNLLGERGFPLCIHWSRTWWELQWELSCLLDAGWLRGMPWWQRALAEGCLIVHPTGFAINQLFYCSPTRGQSMGSFLPAQLSHYGGFHYKEKKV